VGGLERPLPGLVAALVEVLGAEVVVPVVPARRVVDVPEPAIRDVAGAVPAGLEPSTTFFVVVGRLGEAVTPVPVVPAVSSPERMDSSRWITSKLSDSDMVIDLRRSMLIDREKSVDWNLGPKRWCWGWT
jgi:hypothetical protein